MESNYITFVISEKTKKNNCFLNCIGQLRSFFLNQLKELKSWAFILS